MLLRLARYFRNVLCVNPWISRGSHTASTIATPYIVPSEWHTAPGCQSFLSEHEILKRHALNNGYKNSEESLTGVNMGALAYASSHILSLPDIPSIELENKGGFNSLFRLEFKDGRKLIARVPFKGLKSHHYIKSSVAALSFSRYVRNLPAPKVLAWNAGYDHSIGVPFILLEYVENVVEPWRVWRLATDDQRSIILDELANYHAALLSPLPHPLHGFGDLSFAPGLTPTCSLSDPKSYVIRPAHIVLDRPLLEPSKFLGSSVFLPDLWDELWSHQYNLSMFNSGSSVNRDELLLDDDEDCDVVAFKTAASQVQTFYRNAQNLLSLHPLYSQPCLVNYDYAFRNILIDPQTFRVKAFIDWDDVRVMPFIISLNFPEDIMHFSSFGLSPNAEYYQEGAFASFPPKEYGEIMGEVDSDGKMTFMDKDGNSTGVEERDTRIRNTTFRESYIKKLGMRDTRAFEHDMWRVRQEVLKAHLLVMGGGSMWWRKRKWLSEQVCM